MKKLLPHPFYALDVEFSGSDKNNSITEIGIAKFDRSGEIVEQFQYYIEPEKTDPLYEKAIKNLKGKKLYQIGYVLEWLSEKIGGGVIITHNGNASDFPILIQKYAKFTNQKDKKYDQKRCLDTYKISKKTYKKDFSLKALCEKLNVTLENEKRALGDATAAGECFIEMYKKNPEIWTVLKNNN